MVDDTGIEPVTPTCLYYFINRVSLVESYDSWSFDLWLCDSHGDL